MLRLTKVVEEEGWEKWKLEEIKLRHPIKEKEEEEEEWEEG